MENTNVSRSILFRGLSAFIFTLSIGLASYINANHVGFQVRNIETAYSRAKQNGAITVSEGGIIDFHSGRAAMIRDSDVGSYIMLWQPGR